MSEHEVEPGETLKRWRKDDNLLFGYAAVSALSGRMELVTATTSLCNLMKRSCVERVGEKGS